MKILAIDTEETIWSKGDPFDARNKMVCVTWATPPTNSGIWWIEHEQWSGVPDLEEIRDTISQADVVVGFNLKRDLHWLRKYGLWVPEAEGLLFDTQLAEFVLGFQRERYPALDVVSERSGIKLPDSAELSHLWKRGVNTDRIDRELLSRYAIRDATATLELYLQQQARLANVSQHLRQLVKLEMEDLKVLEEMEWNGVMFNLPRMKQGAEKLQQELDSIDVRLVELTDALPVNWASGDHISAVLYGGKLVHRFTEEAGVFKSGAKAGQVKMRHREVTYEMPRLVKPRRKLKKDGYFATDFDTLKALPATGKAKKIRDLLIERANLTKLHGTYLVGIPKKADEMGWTDNIVHGKYNQCVAVTGRLSSSEPNLQNLDARVKEYIVSRYAD